MAESRPSPRHGSDVARRRTRGPVPTLTCAACGTDLEILRRPIRRLSWTRYWWRGVSSLFSQPLRHCTSCGSLYDASGTLVATGATETDAELKTRRFQNDMIGMRDGFGAVVLGSGMTVAWTLLGPVAYEPVITVVAGTVGALALGPCGYFLVKVRQTKRELKKWRKARRQGATGP